MRDGSRLLKASTHAAVAAATEAEVSPPARAAAPAAGATLAVMAGGGAGGGRGPVAGAGSAGRTRAAPPDPCRRGCDHLPRWVLLERPACGSILRAPDISLAFFRVERL